jgi:hypothetical protein
MLKSDLVERIAAQNRHVASVDRAQHRQAPEAAVGKDSLVENVACVKRRTARSKPFGASGRSAARAVIGRQFQ